jgi:type IV secretory pathway VirB6-like protein
MNKKMMIAGAGAALLLGSVALAQTDQSSTNPSSTSATPSSDTSATNAAQSGANTSATASDQSTTTQQAGERG